MSDKLRSLNTLGDIEFAVKRIKELEAKLVRYDDLVADEINLRSENETLKAKLAKVVGLLEAWVNVATHCTIEDGVCCCGDNMDTHAEPMDCGHSPVDHGAHIAMGLAEETETTLAELTGGKYE